MRLLAVTGDASILVALTSMLRGDWEVTIVRDPASAAESAAGAVVALVDFGTTDRGLECVERMANLGATLPCLVVGDRAAPPDTAASVLVRPFELHELIDAVNSLAPKPEVPEVLEVLEVLEPVVEPTIEPFVESASLPEARATGRVDEVAEASLERKPPVDPAGEPRAPSNEDTVQADPVAEAEEQPGDHETAEPRSRSRGLFRRRPAPVASPHDDPLADQIRRALRGLQDLDVLVEKLPPLSRPRAMAHAFLGEVVALLKPETAAVYVLGTDGTFQVTASHGLSAVEAGMRVPPEQLLFMEITSSLEAVLIAPIDLAQGVVAGIGGARTEAIMAAPLTVDGACHGVVVVGRKDFSSTDLDALADLANEAGPGLALAQTIDRMRSR